MGTINLAIISEDREYAEALAWAIVRNSKGTEVWVYDDPEHVDDDVSFDVVLTDVEQNKLAAYLTKNRSQTSNRIKTEFQNISQKDDESRFAGSSYASGWIVLNKFGNVRDLMKKICELCGRTDLMESGRVPGETGAGRRAVYGSSGETSEDVISEKDIYCFVSERGGSGCSKLSRTFAQEQGMYHGRKVLYFSLDQFPEYQLPEYQFGEYGHSNTVGNTEPNYNPKGTGSGKGGPQTGKTKGTGSRKGIHQAGMIKGPGERKGIHQAGMIKGPDERKGIHQAGMIKGAGERNIITQIGMIKDLKGIEEQTEANGTGAFQQRKIEAPQKSLKEYLYRLLKTKNNVPDSKNVSGSARFSNNDIAQIERSERSTVINDTNQNSLKTDNGNPSISTYLEEDENGVMFFKAGEGFNPLLELDEKEYMIFMNAIMEGRGHDMIVIDCGNQVSMQMIRSMELSRRVFLVKDSRPENKGWRKSVGHLLDDESRKKIILADSL